jgi:subtilisin family serine protease
MLSRIGRSSRRLALVVGVVTALGGVVSAVPASSAVAPDSPGSRGEAAIVDAGSPLAVPNQFIVVLKDSGADVQAVQAGANELAGRYGASIIHTYGAALKGFAVKADPAQARRLAADPQVAYVEQDRTVSLNVSVQPNPPSWGLDRIDERSLPLDLKYHYPGIASGIKAYIIDTGIRYTHQEFGGRAIFGTDTVGGIAPPGMDCHGHGTHVAGTVGGRTVGVAKGATLVAVRVLNCAGSGTTAGVIAGVNWVTTDASTSTRPSVANMSLGGGLSAALNTAVTNSIIANVHYSVAAGNSFGADACNASPASTPRATTVGATDITDTVAAFSNLGTCLDLFAPGVNIYSAWATADNAYNTISGTSMAAPHAAGTAALWRARFPADNADTVAKALVVNATPGVVLGLPAAPPSPNLLLFMGAIPV